MSLFLQWRRRAVLAGLSLMLAASAAAAAQGRVRVVEVVSYEQLGGHVGEEIVVRTTLGSRRSGTLVRYTRTALRLKLDSRDGGVELDIPSSSVRDIEVASESDTTPGGDSAKKN
ncbi:hypothetical protein DFR29_12552 [Tahibacter aquaticus]|uniref:PRC-barrel domain-containing protein n=1 Tax=Tahibacter aquaticus TaxID=520092 RepID=A0A4R6YK07_9GAMM|nr:hypothetical protein [Tahibacter aquaticus]TDR37389.1 hypothetical protein DFR29_12552 [Tahibacter aquaticus]